MKKLKFLKWVSASLLLCLAAHSYVRAQSIVASGYTFTASSKTYTYLSGGTAVTSVQADDAYTTIPIGFTFRFCGVNYTDVTVCSNGWLRFGSGVGSASANWNYNSSPGSGLAPAVYPLYEDVSGAVGTSSYLVSGTAPNRIFKWECRDWLWDYAASSASVSFQVWLYETSGKVECLYKQESGSVSVGTSGGATIGIENSSTDWQSLNGVGSSPTSSTSTFTGTLSSRPATGQSYLWDPGAPCTVPTGLIVNLVNSMYVDFSWNVATPSVGYEYVIDLLSTDPLPSATVTSTAVNAGNKGGLTPNTVYYIHLRNKCGNNNYSSWVTLSFKTLPPCVIAVPPGIQFPQIDSNSATITWQTVGTATQYEYTLGEDNTPPPGTSGIIPTIANQVNLTNLKSGQTYYVYLRVKCDGGDSSAWISDSFYVPIPCRAPAVEFKDLNTNRVVVYWPTPATAYEYEIINSDGPLSNPTAGISLVHNSYLFSFLDPSTQYFVYARSYCKDRNVPSVSDWSATPYTTWALGVDDVFGKSSGLKVHPNPVTSQMTVSMADKGGDKAKLRILDLTGRVVQVVDFSGKEKIEMNVNSLSPGIYVLQFSDATHTEQIRFTKQ